MGQILALGGKGVMIFGRHTLDQMGSHPVDAGGIFCGQILKQLYAVAIKALFQKPCPCFVLVLLKQCPIGRDGFHGKQPAMTFVFGFFRVTSMGGSIIGKLDGRVKFAGAGTAEHGGVVFSKIELIQGDIAGTALQLGEEFVLCVGQWPMRRVPLMEVVTSRVCDMLQEFRITDTQHTGD